MRRLIPLAFLLVASCATEPVIVTETYVPEVSFPTFPDPRGQVEFDPKTETVSMPLSYWQQITDYVIDVRAAEEALRAYDE